MSRQTWMVAGALGVLGVAAGTGVAMGEAPEDETVEPIAFADATGIEAENRLTASEAPKAEPGHVNFSAHSVTSPISQDSPNSPASAESADSPASADSPESADSPPSPVSPPSPNSPESADSPDSPDSPPSPPSAD